MTERYPGDPFAAGTSLGPVIDAEILIIGSGAGGASTAQVLTDAGFDVLIVEEGPWIDQGTLVPYSLEQMEAQYRSGGVTVALGRPSVAYTEGRCAGGGTEINSGLYRRPPVEVLERWRADFRIDDLDIDHVIALADRVEADLTVGPMPGEPTPASLRLADGARRLGWQHGEIPRWMAYAPDGTTGVRQSMTRTYLRRAVDAGARLALGCRVDRIDIDARRARRAWVDLDDGRRGCIRFGHAFVCGGAIQTPALLQRSGLGLNIGGNLAVHPTVKLAARFAERVNVPDEVPVHQVTEFAPDLSFGGSASNAGLVALALSDNWHRFGTAVETWEQMSVYYAAITSEGRGMVRALPGLPDPLVTYRLTRHDRHLLRSGLARLAHVLLAAGATEVFPAFAGAPVVRNGDDLTAMQRAFSARRASVMTVHLCSTVPMGEDPRRCGAHSHGRVRRVDNLYVNDASLLPTAPGVNPQGTVMALALRNAEAFARERR